MAITQSVIDEQFMKLVDEIMIDMELDDFQGIWDIILGQYHIRKERHERFHADLERVEAERRDRMTALIGKAVDDLIDIGYGLLPDIEMIVEKETHHINQVIIANKSSFNGKFCNYHLFQNQKKSKFFDFYW